MPTDQCLRLLPHAKKVIAEAHLLKGHLDETGLTATLNVGLISTMMTNLIPDTITRLKQVAPNITLDIIPRTSTTLYEMLSKGDLDTAILIEPPFRLPKNLQSQLLRDEPLYFVGPSDLALSPTEALQTLPYIRYGSNSWGGRLSEQYLKDQNLTPDILCTINDMETSTAMVAEGLGNSLLPGWFGREKGTANLTWVKIPGRQYNRRIVIMQRQGSGKQVALNTFANTLEQSHLRLSAP